MCVKPIGQRGDRNTGSIPAELRRDSQHSIERPLLVFSKVEEIVEPKCGERCGFIGGSRGRRGQHGELAGDQLKARLSAALQAGELVGKF